MQNVLYGLCETKLTAEELELYIIDLGPVRHSAGRNKILLLYTTGDKTYSAPPRGVAWEPALWGKSRAKQSQAERHHSGNCTGAINVS
jgi:hypothetical protein